MLFKFVKDMDDFENKFEENIDFQIKIDQIIRKIENSYIQLRGPKLWIFQNFFLLFFKN